MTQSIMTQPIVKKLAIGISTVVCAALLSFGWSEERGLSLSVDSAQARVGRPLTPVSVAGVARRHTRRAVVGAGVVGAGAVAAGTAAAVAATTPGWGTPGYYAGAPYGSYAMTREDYRRINGMACEPGTMTKLGDGKMYRCQ